MPEERFVTGLRERADKSAEELMEGLEAYCLREDSHFYDYEVSHLLL